MAQKTDNRIIGQRFGKLLVQELTTERNSEGRSLYRCLCECGGSRLVAANRLLSGDVKSCGCARKTRCTRSDGTPIQRARTPKTEAIRTRNIMSGAEGIYYRKADNVWCAQIKIHEKSYHISAEVDKEAAYAARQEIVDILLREGETAAVAEMERRKDVRRAELTELRKQFGGFPTRAQMAEMRQQNAEKK